MKNKHARKPGYVTRMYQTHNQGGNELVSHPPDHELSVAKLRPPNVHKWESKPFKEKPTKSQTWAAGPGLDKAQNEILDRLGPGH